MNQAHEFADGSHQSRRTMMGVAPWAASDAGLPLLPGLLHPDRWLLGLGAPFHRERLLLSDGVVGRPLVGQLNVEDF
jgi:hypothetical protein